MAWLRRLWNTLRPDRVEREIDREMSFHLAERADQLRSEGLTDQEAMRRARAQFGSVAIQRERTRTVDVSLWLDAVLRDLRYGLRALGRTPAFTITVVLTLALGIGANTAAFSVIDAVLLRPLPFPDGDRLVRLRQTQATTAETNIAPVRLEDWNRLNATFDAITGYYMEDVSETSGELPERVRRAFVAPRFLDVWGVRPARGRGFTSAEHRDGGPGAVLISDRYWRIRLGADPDVLDRTIRLGTATFPIIGVMPASFRFPDRSVDVWFPIALDNKYAVSRRNTWYSGVGRLKAGVTAEQARADLAAVQARLADEYPDTDRRIGVDVAPLKDVTVGGVRRSLWLLFGGVSVLLLITCTNIAGLLLSRGAHRRQEIAVRLSIGASPIVVARQILIETFVLSLAGGALGLAAAALASAALRSAAASLPRMDEIGIDWRIGLYTLVSAVLVALLCGILPAWHAARDRIAGALNEAGRAQVSGRNAMQWLLVGAQLALSVALLAGAGLLVRSVQQLWRVDAGFDTSHVLTFRVSGSYAETANYQRLLTRIDTTIEALRALPGVDGVATTTFLPGVPTEFERPFTLVEATGDAERRLVAENRIVSPEYFATMRVPLIEGAVCERRPIAATRTAVVNRSFATRYLSDRPSVIGLHLTTSGESVPGRITGIVADAREQGLDRMPVPTVYWCFSAPNPTPYFLVRTRGEPLDLAQSVRVRIKDLEPLRSVYNIAPLEDQIGEAFAQNRLRTRLLAAFSLMAISLACVGLYGALSYAVSLRRREIGLRLALGAMRSGIIRQFVAQALRTAIAACGCGLVLSAAFTRLLAGMLYGVSPLDPLIFSTVAGSVLIVATLAALIPAARAAFVNPTEVLRQG